jgi:hypothetical protein
LPRCGRQPKSTIFARRKRPYFHDLTGESLQLLRNCEINTCLPKPFRLHAGLPSKTIAKNFVPLITYRHSADTFFEKGSSGVARENFAKNFLRVRPFLSHVGISAAIQKLGFGLPACSLATLAKTHHPRLIP